SYLNSNNRLNAGNWFPNQYGRKDSYKYNEGSLSLGGPLARNKLFGYVDYELLRQPNTIDRGPVYTLSAADSAEIAADSTGIQVNSQVADLLKQIPAPNFGGPIAGPVFYGQYPYCSTTANQFVAPSAASMPDCYEHSESARTASDNVIAKLDYVLSKNNAIVASYAWNRLGGPYETLDLQTPNF